MGTSIVRVFETRSAAEAAVRDLKAAGYTDAQISLVGRNGAADEATAESTGEGAAVGAAAGAVGGAAVTIGLMTGVIPVLGPVIALGWLGTALLNAAGGAAAIGLVGALTGWGLSESDAKYYEGEVAAGRYLVTVHDDGDTNRARDVFARHRTYDRVMTPAV
ncbi:general stress protein [Limnoglobus roseus]|uniref:General stress protein 17M-like domain-containing protein n=1 Tax=Limnoglobus roseus TaxID=2598579 RepID=A0A5C1AJM5_9BACT|nr:general stress protein [Limnoglobus roseus]QEL18393.1 hypothetical protein PX52LOC_05417 [Limnoglobus roseus]